ncbi:MAG TPA: FlgD immunoglobulin-like domain containing protein [Prolixibacteraceae bacterium]|nr:FlgD immunoglobulin-like domain containing protein [Prolixibacteraceae bacterium]
MKTHITIPVLVFFLLTIQPLVSWSKPETSVVDSLITGKYTYYATIDNILTIEDGAPDLPKEGRIPLLLVHGWSFDGRPAAPGGHWEYFTDYLKNDAELSRYFKPYLVRYWSNAVSVEELAALLRDKVQEAGMHEQPLILIGHSMGGLVSRSFMNEQLFTTGAYAGERCGENVRLLITLSSPLHGSPMANGPARDNKVNFLMKVAMSAVELTLFSDNKYNEVNRSDLRWDNYDNLFNYSKFPSDKNDWLANLNSITLYDSKLVCYSASVTGSFKLPPYADTNEQYKAGSYLMKECFGFTNDGIVPIQSSSFEGHTPKKVRYFSEYTHADIAKGKGDHTELFNPMKQDLLEVIPPQLVNPLSENACLKYGQPYTIQWLAPSTTSKVNLYFSGDNGQSYTLLADQVDAAQGAYQWSLPDTNLTQCRFKVTNATDESLFASSPYPFTIYHNRLTILSPLAGSYFVPGKTNTICWQQTGIATRVRLVYHDPKNNFTDTIAPEFPVEQTTNRFDWAVEHNIIPATDSAYITIEMLPMKELSGDEENYTFTSSPFMMLGEPGITFNAPATFPTDEFGVSGEKMVIDSFYTVKWQTEGEIKSVTLSLCDSSKKVLQTIKTKNQRPGIHSSGFTNWRVPGMHGDAFYLKLEGGPDQNTITATTHTEFPFRINRKSAIIAPANHEKSVALIPCVKMDSIAKATGYRFEIVDSLTGGVEFERTYGSALPGFCIPNTLEDELTPGETYQLTASALFDTIVSYPSRIHFQAAAIKPMAFQTILPVQNDTIEGTSMKFAWSRSVGTATYQVEITNQGKLLASKLYNREDTVVSISIGKSGRPDTIFWKVTAKNDFGETVAQSYFFKKNITGVEFLPSGKQEDFNLINYPNPFDHETTLEFVLPGSDQHFSTEIAIYNLSGQKIRMLSKAERKSGKQTVVWDGKNDSGQRVEKGMYTIYLTVDQKPVTRLLIAK